MNSTGIFAVRACVCVPPHGLAWGGTTPKEPISLNLQFRVEASGGGVRSPIAGSQEMKNVHAHHEFAPVPANAS